MEGGSEIGTQGWVRYRFPDIEQAKNATVLAHFAFFANFRAPAIVVAAVTVLVETT